MELLRPARSTARRQGIRGTLMLLFEIICDDGFYGFLHRQAKGASA